MIVQAGVYVDEYVYICGECRVQCTNVYWTYLYSAVSHEALDTVIQDLWELWICGPGLSGVLLTSERRRRGNKEP